MRFEGKTAVVTGASGGIGRACAFALAREGARLVVHYERSREAAERVVGEIRELGREATVLQADVSREADVSRLVGESLAALGRLDVWMNIAGVDILTGRAREWSDIEKLERVIAVDLRGTVLCSWAVAEIMVRQGSGAIVNMAWDYDAADALGPVPEAFAATKGGVEAFSKNLALRVAPGVRVNVVAPGWIETAYGRGVSPRFRERIATSIPMRRWGTPEDVAGAALFLASDDAAYVTGQTIRIDGGKVA